MPSCVVPGCRFWKLSERPKGVKLHNFPKEEALRKVWFSVCGRKDLESSESERPGLRVCSSHFVPSDYARDLRWELTNRGKGNIMENPNRRLNPGSIPSQLVPYPDLAQDDMDSVSSRADDSGDSGDEESSDGDDREKDGDGQRRETSKTRTEMNQKKREAVAAAKKALEELKARNREARRNAAAAAGRQAGETAERPMDPEERARLVEQAMKDAAERENRHRQVEAALNKFRLTGNKTRSLAEELWAADTAALMKNRPQRSPAKTRRKKRMKRFVSPPPSSDDYVSDDDALLASADCLDRQLVMLIRMQRKIAELERRLRGRRLRLQEATRKYQEAVLVLDERRGMDVQMDKRKLKPPARTPLAAASSYPPAGSLMVLRDAAEFEEEADLPPGDDLLTLPTDLPMALRVISRLRLEVLALRSRVLLRAFRETAMRCEMMDVNREHAEAEVRWMDSLDAVFTPAQKSRLRPDCRHVPWAEEDFLRTISLRWVCRRRAFEYVRRTMNIPLPSMFSVRAVAAFGRFPEVTKRYNELAKHKKLSFTRQISGSESENSDVETLGGAKGEQKPPDQHQQQQHLTSQQQPQRFYQPPLDAHMPNEYLPTEEMEERPTASRGRGRGRGRGQSRGAGTGKRGRRRAASPPQSPSKRTCWDTSGGPPGLVSQQLDDWGAPVHEQPAAWAGAGRLQDKSDDSDDSADEYSNGRMPWSAPPPARGRRTGRPAWAGM